MKYFNVIYNLLMVQIVLCIILIHSFNAMMGTLIAVGWFNYGLFKFAYKLVYKQNDI